MYSVPLVLAWHVMYIRKNCSSIMLNFLYLSWLVFYITRIPLKRRKVKSYFSVTAKNSCRKESQVSRCIFTRFLRSIFMTFIYRPFLLFVVIGLQLFDCSSFQLKSAEDSVKRLQEENSTLKVQLQREQEKNQAYIRSQVAYQPVVQSSGMQPQRQFIFGQQVQPRPQQYVMQQTYDQRLPQLNGRGI